MFDELACLSKLASQSLRLCASVSLSVLIFACVPSVAPPSYPPATPDRLPSAPAVSSPTSTQASVPTPPQMQNNGTLAGHVTIGPLSPGPVRIGVTPLPVPPEAFAARTIQIFAADGVTLVTNVKISPDGTYSVTLPTADYVINLARNGIDRGRDLPKKVVVNAGEQVRIDIDIDTGIR